MTSTDERRRFTRVPFDTSCTIVQGTARIDVDLLDISLNGALVSRPDNLPSHLEGPIYLDIELTDQTQISMEVELAHSEENSIGFSCKQLDMDSASHLRRLIELNIGTENAAERVLEELISRHKVK